VVFLVLGGFWEGKIGGVNAGTDIGAQGVHVLGFTKLNATSCITIFTISLFPMLRHVESTNVIQVNIALAHTASTGLMLLMLAEPLESEVDLHVLMGLVGWMILQGCSGHFDGGASMSFLTF
jgi:hypothetical protein